MKNKIRTSIATRLVVYVILMVSILFTVMMAFSYNYAKKEVIEDSLNSTQSEIKHIDRKSVV